MSKVLLGNLKGPKGDPGGKGDPGPAGPNTIPTNQAVADAIATPGPAKSQLETTTVATAVVVNPRAQFGATGDGVTDDSDALREAIVYSLTRKLTSTGENRRIVIPAGIYNIHDDKFFSNFDFAAYGLSTSVRDGLVFIGEGRTSTVINLITNGTEKWFYNNESITKQKFQKLYFEKIRFTTDNPEFGNGFKQFSQGGEKQFRFYDCEFNLGTVLQTEGTGNADLNRFLMCYITASRNVLVLNNAQSVANDFVSCDINLSRSLVTILAGGGGATRFIGGNFEMHDHPTDTATDHYLIDSPVAPATGQGNAETTITDVRFEIHGARKKFVRTVGTTGQLNITFARCSFGTVTGGDREVATVTASRRLRFDNCILHSAMLFKAEATFAGSAGNPSGAQIVFEGCDVGLGPTLASRCTATGDTARIVADGCFRQNSSTTNYPRIAEDFDFGWRGAAPRGIPARVKTIAIKPVAAAMPLASTATSALPRVTLPVGAYVRRILVKKAPHTGGASDADAYQLFVGSADKATTLGSSALGTWGGAHLIELNDVGVLSFDTIAVWAGGGTGSAFSGGVGTVMYVEYI